MMKHKLPANWIVVSSKSHPDRVYYFNIKTNQSSWTVPTSNQIEQVNKKNGSPRKRRKTAQKDEGSREPTTPEHDLYTAEVSERNKLVAKRSLRQTQEKCNEEKETPQMKAIREKMLRKREKDKHRRQNAKVSKSSENVIKSPASESEKTAPLVQKSDINSNLKIANTPQMQVLLKRIEERASKHVSKTKKPGNSSSMVHQEAKIVKPQLRNKGACNQSSIVEVSLLLENKNKKEEWSSTKIEVGKRKNKEDDLVEVISPSKRSRMSFKKNLGKERMEKLRGSLSTQYSSKPDSSIATTATCSPTHKSEEKIPSMYKKAEVRLGESDESATTVNDLINRCDDKSLCEEMDWEPLEDEKIMFEVQAVRTQLCTENSTHMTYNISSKTLTYPTLEPQAKRHLYIVVDTNVFLSNINAIDLARETTLKTYDLPLIVIPWTVIRELDYIKDDNGKTKPASLCLKARKAINYINKLFSSKQPRIITQTPEDVAKNKEKFSIDCPDDEILQTCLQIRDMGKSVVLLSYDVNLCNKAMIYDIETLGRNDPLEKIDYLNASKFINESLSNSNIKNSLDSISILSQEVSFSDEIYEDIQSIIRDFLTVIVSKEMLALYGDSWEKYVLVRPPWTTVTVLQCAVKHWIAAVSDSFQRQAESILKELLQVFKDPSAKRSLKENAYILDKCSALVQMIQINKHSGLMLRVSKKIDELKDKCHEYEIQINSRKLRDAIGTEDNIAEQERRAQKAFQYFETAYVYARDMCGLAAEAAAIPCSFHYNIPDPLPPMSYVKQMQPSLASSVNKLINSLNAVMEQVKKSCIDYRTLMNLHQTLITFLPEIAPLAIKLTNVDLTPLDVYCCVKQKEDVLDRGLRQLQELSTHFCRLANCT